MVKFELGFKNKLVVKEEGPGKRGEDICAEGGKSIMYLTNFMMEAWNGVRECMNDKEGRDRIPKALSDTLRNFALFYL